MSPSVSYFQGCVILLPFHFLRDIGKDLFEKNTLTSGIDQNAKIRSSCASG